MIDFSRITPTHFQPISLGPLTDPSSKIGGMPPDGIETSKTNMEYLLTVRLDSSKCVSAFASRDFKDLLKNRLTVLDSTYSGFDLLFHRPLAASSKSVQASVCSPQGLITGGIREESYGPAHASMFPTSECKFGGRPFIRTPSPLNLSLFERPIQLGFSYFMQLDLESIDPSPLLLENFPSIGMMTIHIFLKKASRYDWYCILDF